MVLVGDFLFDEVTFQSKKQKAVATAEAGENVAKLSNDFESELKAEVGDLENWFTEKFVCIFLENVFDVSFRLR